MNAAFSRVSIISLWYITLKCALNLHIICTNKVLIDALVLMLLAKLIQNSTISRCSSRIFLKLWCKIGTNYNANFDQLAPKFMQIRYHKGSGTQMHKCLVRTIIFNQKFFHWPKKNKKIILWLISDSKFF